MPDTIFEAALTDVQEDCYAIAEYLSAAGTQRPWMIPSTGGWTFEPTDISGMGEPFDRTQVNQDYEYIHAGGGDFNEVQWEAMAAHIQIGYLGCMERAFRERHKLMPRAWAHVQGRKWAHGNSAYGVHTGSVLQHIIDIEATV